MIKLAGLTLCCLFCAVLLKEHHRSFAVAVALVGACILFFSVATQLKDIIAQISQTAAGASSSVAYLRLMLKVLGMTLLTQLLSDLCRDNGESALATMTETTAKVLVVVLVLPLFSSVLSIVSGLVR